MAQEIENKLNRTYAIDAWQIDGLETLNRRTRVPTAIRVRDAITALLAEHGIVEPGTLAGTEPGKAVQNGG